MSEPMTEAEVNALTGDDIRYWLENPFMTPDLLVEKVCFWVTAATIMNEQQDVMAIKADRDKLRRWKDEALPVLMGLQDLGRALDMPLGVNITGPAAVEAARTLRAKFGRVEALADHWMLSELHWRRACGRAIHAALDGTR